VSESFVQGYFLRLREDVTNLGRVVDLVHEDLPEWRRNIATLKANADGMVQEFRDQYRRDSSSVDRDLPELPCDPARPAAYLLRRLERLVARELAYPWTATDGVDFMHAAIAGTCADCRSDEQIPRR
jgi:hypothetical protein